MENYQLFPFERNRYYSGKMLTSVDFLAEQRYMNDKRRFLNHLVLGSGILCGLSVFNLDDLSVLIESGVAVDESGREIVIEQGVVKKLSAIEGFHELTGKCGSLCIRYKETQVHPVYAIHSQDNEREYEYNRIQEGYELFLMDSGKAKENFHLESEFFLSSRLLDGKDYRIDAVIPATVCVGKWVRLSLYIEKNTDTSLDLNLDIVLQLPVFLSEQGEHELNIEIDHPALEQEEVWKKDFWIYTEENDIAETEIILKYEKSKVVIGTEIQQLSDDFGLKVIISRQSPFTLAALETGRLSLEMRDMGKKKDYVRLADLELIRTESAYIIEKIHKTNEMQYILAPGLEQKREEYLSCFREPCLLPGNRDLPDQTNRQEMRNTDLYENRVMASGILEIPFDIDAKKGDICYSDEIMHGLGKGTVYVEVGMELLEDDRKLNASIRNTVYGDISLFQTKDYAINRIETAVKVFHDKGTFQVAAKLKEEKNSVITTLRWAAIKFTDTIKLTETDHLEQKGIAAETPTVRLKPKESYFFHVRFLDISPCSLCYELTENGSGEVTADGIYTAPGKEGVYEIRIYCLENPRIMTYAYAVVKK